MKIIYVLLACAAAQAVAGPLPERTRAELAATSVEFTAERDAAAVFVRERSWFLHNMGRLCVKELNMPASTQEGPADRWQRNNYRFSATAIRYQGKRGTTKDPGQGFMDGMDEIRRIDEKTAADAKAQLKAAPDRVQACQVFFADSEAGKQNIRPGDQYYDVLETLAHDLFDPVPSH